MTKKYIFAICFALILIINLTSCEQIEKNNKPIVAVSIVPQKTFVKAVAGDNVDVVVMIPPGYSPANYAPSPKELKKLSNASLYFSLGVPTEKVNIIPKLKSFNNDIDIIKLDKEVSKIYPDRFFGQGQDEINRDPHIWLSPKRVQVMIDIIARELVTIDSQNQSIYKENAENYKQKLDELDKELKDVFNELDNKTFIVYHPSFGYFADDYGFEMIGLEEDGKELTPKRLQQKIDIAKEKGIKVIFYQAEIDSKQSKAFANEINGKAQLLEPLAANYIENIKKIANVFKGVME